MPDIADRTHRIPDAVRRLWPLAAAVPLGVLAAAGYAVLAPPAYTANSYVVVAPDQGTDAPQAVNFAQAYGRLAGQPQVLALAAGEAGHTPDELTALVSTTTSPDAPVIEIDGTGGQPQDAARTADAVAHALIGFGNGSSHETGVHLVPLAAAAAPDRPTSPNRTLDLGIGAAAGVLVGSLAVLVRRQPDADEPTAGQPDAEEPDAEKPDAERPDTDAAGVYEPSSEREADQRRTAEQQEAEHGKAAEHEKAAATADLPADMPGARARAGERDGERTGEPAGRAS